MVIQTFYFQFLAAFSIQYIPAGVSLGITQSILFTCDILSIYKEEADLFVF